VAAPAAPTEGPEASVQVVGAQLGPDWIRQLQAWWDRHAFYPGEAAQQNVSGTLKAHVVVQPDGEVSTIHVEQSSGSRYLDNAAYQAFTDAHLHPFPPGTPAPKADVYITLHYVLTHGDVAAAAAVSKRPFTVTDKPIAAAKASSLQQKTCTGRIVVDSATGGLDSWYGRHGWARADFYRGPDGKPRVKFSTSWYSADAAVNESNGSAGWLGPEQHVGPPGMGMVQLKYSLFPAGPDHVGGSVFDIYKPDTKGAIELNCDQGPSEQTQR
jgi:TonB family protein